MDEKTWPHEKKANSPWLSAALLLHQLLHTIWERQAQAFQVVVLVDVLSHTDNSQRKRKAEAHEKVALLPWAQNMQ